MGTWSKGSQAVLFGAALCLSSPITVPNAQAAQPDYKPRYATRPVSGGLIQPISIGISALPQQRPIYRLDDLPAGRTRLAPRAYLISCVPYARQVSGIKVVGNAWQWWSRAAGVYARGDQPEVGSILNFRANRRMPLGHVAVVDRVINPREVLVEHANWGSFGMRGPITKGVKIVDVSEANNWSAVRVELGRTDGFGSVYPTYGFIYNRPDPGILTISAAPPAPQPDINPIPSDLRPRAERPWRTVEEVAQASGVAPYKRPPTRLDLRIVPVSDTP